MRKACNFDFVSLSIMIQYCVNLSDCSDMSRLVELWSDLLVRSDDRPWNPDASYTYEQLVPPLSGNPSMLSMVCLRNFYILHSLTINSRPP